MDKEIISSSITHDGGQASDDDKTKLRNATQAIIDALTAPEYVAALQAVKDAPMEKRLLEATQRLTPDALRKAGVKLPDGMRISSRYFESDLPKPLDFGDFAGGKPNPLAKLSTANPGLLDDLRANNPLALTAFSDESASGGNMSDLPMAKIGGCTCGGGPLPLIPGTACGGGGYYL
jgi:hypothetical protein